MKNRWVKNIGLLFSILLLALFLTACGSSVGGINTGNGDDNGDNGDTCTSTESTEVTCDDGIDNDCDGLIDGSDSDCSCTATESTETSCNDDVDNDCDELVDGNDPDCQPQYVAVGDSGTVVLSGDKDNWIIGQTNTDQSIQDVAQGSWVAVGIELANGIVASVDDVGNVITEHTVSLSAFSGVANDGSDTWIAVGTTNGGTVGITSKSEDDGVSWDDNVGSPLNSTESLNEVAYGNGMWVTVGLGGKIFFSDDGENWQAATSNSSTDLWGVAYGGNDQWVAVGSTPAPGVSDATIVHTTTANLNEWTSAEYVGDPAKHILNDVASAGDNRWVAVGAEGIIYFSDNGTHWARSTESAIETGNTLMGVAYDGTDWVAVGSVGTIIHTEDGDIDSWTSATNTPDSLPRLNSIAIKLP